MHGHTNAKKKLVAVSARTYGNILPTCTASHGINPHPRDVQFKYLLNAPKSLQFATQDVPKLEDQVVILWNIRLVFRRYNGCFHCSEYSGEIDMIRISIEMLASVVTQPACFIYAGKNQIVVRCCYNTHRYCRNVAARSLQHSIPNPKNLPWLRIKFLSSLHSFLSSVSKMKATAVTCRNMNTKTRK
jgi:hypothetical protein